MSNGLCEIETLPLRKDEATATALQRSTSNDGSRAEEVDDDKMTSDQICDDPSFSMTCLPE
jgi:hypothetical protein